MKKNPGSRLSQFNTIDKPPLKSLPLHSYKLTKISQVRRHIDYHVKVDKHYYSVHYTFFKQQLKAHVTGELIQLYHQDKLVAVHPRAYVMVAHHKLSTHADSTSKTDQMATYTLWALGKANLIRDTEQLVILYLQQRKHQKQNYRRCLSLLNLTRKYTQKVAQSSMDTCFSYECDYLKIHYQHA